MCAHVTLEFETRTCLSRYHVIMSSIPFSSPLHPLTRWILGLIWCALCLTCGLVRARTSTDPVLAVEATDMAQVLYVGFTPPAGVSHQLVSHIDQARSEVLVQAYGFTHNAIAQALVRAHQRGVKVHVILDEKSDSTNRYVISLLRTAGVPLFSDGAHAIAHNKVMVMDGQVVVTGSFNFTNSAETRNAENLLILRSPQLAQSYRQNWLQHQQHARSF
jgi:phosphatidylserine/phosphatidylglycerophosphate/cardiolipin synthase-like enzyme